MSSRRGGGAQRGRGPEGEGRRGGGAWEGGGGEIERKEWKGQKGEIQ